MANDNKPKYARIGFAVVVGVVAISAALIYIGGFGGSEMEFLVESYYDKPVSGLSVGSPVNFRGVKVGEVKDVMMVRPRSADYSVAEMQRIRILLSLNLQKMGHRARPEDFELRRMIDSYVKHGLRATVAASGITGLSRIELNMLPNPPPLANLNWKPAHPVIPPAPSLIDNFSDTATKLMNQINKMDFASAWTNIQTIAESLSHLASNIDLLMEGQRANIGALLENASETAARLNSLSQRLEENPSLLLRSSAPDPLPETDW